MTNLILAHDLGIKMEYMKKYPDSKRSHSDRMVKIFSNEHGYYYRGAGAGYTAFPDESETRTLQSAFARTSHCGKEKKIWFIYVDQTHQIECQT